MNYSEGNQKETPGWRAASSGTETYVACSVLNGTKPKRVQNVAAQDIGLTNTKAPC
jgi:hypothetical protein